MSVDILAKLFEGSITLDDAYEIYYRAMESDQVDVPGLLGLINTEWTAHAHGVPWDVIARWRYEGWPDVCPMCGQSICVPEYGWFAVEMSGGWMIVHIRCLEEWQGNE